MVKGVPTILLKLKWTVGGKHLKIVKIVDLKKINGKRWTLMGATFNQTSTYSQSHNISTPYMGGWSTTAFQIPIVEVVLTAPHFSKTKSRKFVKILEIIFLFSSKKILAQARFEPRSDEDKIYEANGLPLS